MMAGSPWLQSALNFCVNAILMCYSCSKVFEPLHPCKGW